MAPFRWREFNNLLFFSYLFGEKKKQASYVGVKENVPPFLDPTLSMNELITGVSFASAGTGYDPLTPTISVRTYVDE